MENMLEGKTLFISGGTGSFGNAVLDRFLNTDLAEIRIFSRDEKKQDEMRYRYPNSKLKFYIGDVREPASIDPAIEGCDYVFHAAALKQVPSCEFYPMEATKTNVIGTENMLSAALRHNISKFVCLSTDKAVYPINAMGISKALMEKVVQAKSRLVPEGRTIFCCTRYGNVMASRGSVIPKFVDQMINDEPISITDPEMTRFIMSLEEAVELVFFAFKNATQGDLFVQKSPATSIQAVATALKKIFNSSSEIKIIGTRHGEKKHETLLSREELQTSESIGNYYRIPMDNRDLNYDLFFSEGRKDFSKDENYSSDNSYQLNLDELEAILRKLPYIKEQLAKCGR